MILFFTLICHGFSCQEYMSNIQNIRRHQLTGGQLELKLGLVQESLLCVHLKPLTEYIHTDICNLTERVQ